MRGRGVVENVGKGESKGECEGESEGEQKGEREGERERENEGDIKRLKIVRKRIGGKKDEVEGR